MSGSPSSEPFHWMSKIANKCFSAPSLSQKRPTILLAPLLSVYNVSQALDWMFLMSGTSWIALLAPVLDVSNASQVFYQDLYWMCPMLTPVLHVSDVSQVLH